MAFVMERLRAGSVSVFWAKIVKRTFLIFMIGFLINWFPFVEWRHNELTLKAWVDEENSIEGVRILGVLQRIAIAYFFASIIAFYTKPRTILYLSGAILMVYWAACIFFGGSDPYSLEGFFGTPIDRLLIGEAHLYKGAGVPFDPEGLVSSFPCIVNVLLGYLAGLLIRHRGEVRWIWTSAPSGNDGHYKLIAGLLTSGILLLLCGSFWDLTFPINKRIWSSSYVLYSSGWAMVALSLTIWFVEVLNVRNVFTRFFDIFGKNPLFIFVLSVVFPKIMGLIQVQQSADIYVSPLKWFYLHVCTLIPGHPGFGSLAYSISFLMVMCLVGYWMDKRKIYVKV